MIGGIQIFLPLSLVEVRACVAEAAERQPAEIVMEEEVEQTPMFSQEAEDENSTKWLKIFSQEAGQEIIAVLETVEEEEEEEEEEADNMDFANLYEELEALERKVMVKGLHIQQDKLEEGSGAYQPQEQLEEAGDTPAGKLPA
jgi:hypothetical protein